MCGIVGYIGRKEAHPILLDGLKSLEYRGYDSAGLAISDGKKISVFKSAGKIIELEKKIGKKPISGSAGIAHTRWATHGKPSTKNSHPHCDCNKNIFLVHNGIIENYQELKENLSRKGLKFRSGTDSEVIAHMMEEFGKKYDFRAAVMET
ncbi:MAG: class II glutamine amidotransferase, partial [Candidatus Moranbacteria bacterium]|nr:class II glutamine amidotransferase [Candidatus Moranbacteria bacterium]